MSYTEIYTFSKDGACEDCHEVKNAWRGALAVWSLLERKYLPVYRPRYVPDYVPDDEVEAFCGFSPNRIGAFDGDAIKEIWNLCRQSYVSETDKIVLLTTLDNVLVKREHIQKVIEAFEAFAKEHADKTNLDQQAAVLKEILEDDEVTAVGWNQTSVNGDSWSNAGETVIDEDGDECGSPYNYKTGNKHWWLFGEGDDTAEEVHE